MSSKLAIGICLHSLVFAFGLRTYHSTDRALSSHVAANGTGLTFQCDSDLAIPNVKSMSKKGICVDDTTLFSCPDKLLSQWPNTQEPIKYMRLFKAYQKDYSWKAWFRKDKSTEKAVRLREELVKHVKANGIKVLVGSSITCSEADDDKDWEHVKVLLSALGKEHVLALAVGNELDQLQHHSYLNGLTPGCLNKLWGGYLFNKTVERIKWARDYLNAPELPVTSVFTAGIVWAPTVFPEDHGARLITYFTKLFDSGEKHYVFTFNMYPIFDPTNFPDADPSKCVAAVDRSSCFDNPAHCLTSMSTRKARQHVQQFVQSNPKWGMKDAPLWVGEIGWSSSAPATYKGPMSPCKAFFSKYMTYQYYKNYLDWNLEASSNDDDLAPPDMTFYFTMRDANNFGFQEYFGLLDSCDSNQCKLTTADTDLP